MLTDRLRLYELPFAYRELDEALADSEGELTPELEALFAQFDDVLTTKADAIAALVRERSAEADAIEKEIKRLKARQRAIVNGAERLKHYLFTTLKALSLTSVKGARFTVRIQRNGFPAIRWLGRVEDLPEEFQRVTVTLDGEKARTAFKANSLPSGFEATVGEHLRIA